MTSSVSLADGAEDNAFAAMLCELVRQNLASKPHKNKDFQALARGRGATVALVADDAEVAITLEFRDARLVLHDGIKGVPDVAVRGTADAIMGLSNMPLRRFMALPLPTDRAEWDVIVGLARATGRGDLKIFGMLGNVGVLTHLTRVMSVNG